jgi:hypothetical protein
MDVFQHYLRYFQFFLTFSCFILDIFAAIQYLECFPALSWIFFQYYLECFPALSGIFFQQYAEHFSALRISALSQKFILDIVFQVYLGCFTALSWRFSCFISDFSSISSDMFNLHIFGISQLFLYINHLYFILFDFRTQ